MNPKAKELGQGLENINLDRTKAPDIALLHKSYKKLQEVLLTLSQNLALVTATLNFLKEEQLWDKHLIHQQQAQLHQQSNLTKSSTDWLEVKSNLLLANKDKPASKPALTHLCFLGCPEELSYFLDNICDFIHQQTQKVSSNARQINFISLHLKDSSKTLVANT